MCCASIWGGGAQLRAQNRFHKEDAQDSHDFWAAREGRWLTVQAQATVSIAVAAQMVGLEADYF
jgi:hypothetical protein